MTAYFRVTNFDELQHYKDRTPPWIKLYNKLLDSYEFGALPDASKAHFLAICLLASRYENRIPCDPKWIARRINATVEVDLELLTSAGLIELEQRCSETLAIGKQNDCLETETETETEKILSNASRVDEKKRSPKKKRRKGAREYDDEFLAWWTAYPKKDAKGDAFDAYWVMRDGGHSTELLQAGANYAASKYAQTEEQFIPLPATFLRREQFLDAGANPDGDGPPDNFTPDQKIDWWKQRFEKNARADKGQDTVCGSDAGEDGSGPDGRAESHKRQGLQPIGLSGDGMFDGSGGGGQMALHARPEGGGGQEHPCGPQSGGEPLGGEVRHKAGLGPNQPPDLPAFLDRRSSH